jgi:hypothetical protein
VIVARLALARVQPALAQRVLELVERVQGGEDAAWAELYQAVPALAACVSAPITGQAGGTLTSAELEQQLGVSRRTIRRRRARGELKPVQAGGPGRAHRWAAEAAR